MEQSPLTDCVKHAANMKAAMLKKGLNPQTINRRLSVVRSVLNKAYKEYDLIAAPLGLKISPLMMSEKEYARQVFLSVDEVTTLLSHIKEQRLKNFFIGLCATGLREGELLKLEQNQYKDGTIRLTSKTKGKRPRAIPVPEWARKAFKTLPMPVTYNHVRAAFERARIASDMAHVRIHDLRHTFASWLVSNPEIPMTVVRDLLGHSSLATTNKYAHLREDALKVATDKTPQVF